MPNRFEFGGVDLTAGEAPASGRPPSETPFCVAILGDFSGRASRGLADRKSVGQRRPIQIDCDNFDEVLAGLKVELHLATKEGSPIVLWFSDLDDFHPDRLYEHSVFRKLREVRERLQDPSTFGEVAQELGFLSPQSRTSGAGKTDDSRAPVPSPVRPASGNLLDDMIEQTEARGAVQATTKTDEVREFARQVAAKHIVGAPDPRQSEIVSAVDQAIGDVMRTILHHADFQALEALWRAVFLLLRQLETGPRLKVYLFDISKAELAADLKSSTDFQRTGIFQILVEKGVQTLGADPWAIVVGNYTFGPEESDVELLSGMAKVAKQAGALFLAGASSRLLRAKSVADLQHARERTSRCEEAGWAELRDLPEAEAVGLALPRFLARLPYGRKTSPVESFSFEEFSDLPSHEDYLWANPAFVIALLLAESFSEAGWKMRPGSIAQLDKLPLHVYWDGAEFASEPCAETLLTEDLVEWILEEGMIPLISYKGRDSIRIPRFQSIARPSKRLAGRWSS